MENNLPEWFNQEEFNEFLAERQYNIHSQRAERRAARIFFDAKRRKRETMAKTGPGGLRRGLQTKAAIGNEANRRVANIRYQADLLDAKDKQARVGMYGMAESISDTLDLEYENFLAEAAKRGSNRDVNLGTKPSANERASERNLTGDPKVQAREKKSEQRKDNRTRPKPTSGPVAKRKLVKIGASRKGGVLAKGSAKDASKFIGVKIKSGKEKGAIEIIPKDEYKEDVHQILVGSKDDEGKKATKGELTQLASEDKFQRTKSSDFLGISRPDDKKEDKKEKPETRRGGARRRKEARVKSKAKRESRRGEKKEAESAGGQQPQMMLGSSSVSATARPVPGAKLGLPAFNGEYTDIPYAPAELASVISNLTSDHEANDAVEQLIGSSKKRRTSERIKEYQDLLNQNPQIAEIGKSQMVSIIQSLIQTDPLYAKAAERMDPSELIKQFTAIPTELIRGCVENSDFFKELQISNTKTKSDVLVFPTEKASSIIGKITSKTCDFDEEELSMMRGVSIKKGKAQVAGVQEKETAAVMEAVARKMEMLLNNPRTKEAFQKALYSGGGESFDYLQKIKQLIEVLKSITTLISTKNYFGGKVNFSDFDDPGAKEKLYRTNPQAAAQLEQIKTKSKDVEEIAKALFNNPIIKVLILHEQLTGEFKFKNRGKSKSQFVVGQAQQLMFLDERGVPTHSLAIPTVEELLEGPNSENDSVQQFYAFARKQQIRASVKPRRSRTGTFFNPVFRTAEDFSFYPANLDFLFEAQFEPYDREIVTTVANLDVDDDKPDVDSAQQPEQKQEDDFVPFNGMTPEEFAKAVNYNFIRILQGAGYEITDFSTNIFDAGEEGLALASMNNPERTTITYNGREFKIPVLNSQEVTEEIINEYNDLNDEYVELLKQGHDLDEVLSSFLEESNEILLERDYKREYRLYHSKPKHRKERSRRVLARRKMIKRHGKKALLGKDIDHKDGNAMNNGDSNLRVRSINSNRADNKHRKGEIKEETHKKPNWLNKLTGSWEYTNFLLNAIPGQNNIDKGLRALLSKNKGQSR